MRKFLAFSLLFIPLVLTAIGILELSSINKFYATRQIIWVSAGLFIAVANYFIPSRLYNSLAPLFYILAVLLLLMVLALPSNGPKRWMHLGAFYFQPSELAKLAYIFFIARWIAKHPRLNERRVTLLFIFTFIPFSLVLIEPDLATSGSFFFLFTLITFLAGADLKILNFIIFSPVAAIFSFKSWIFLVFLIATLVYLRLVRMSVPYTFIFVIYIIFVGLFSPYIWFKVLKPYQRARIVAFLEPEKYKTGPAWQILQGEIALGSGGLKGKGLHKGTQKGLSFLPAAHTDFIFSSIGEEMGFITTSFILIALFLFSFLIFQIGYQDRDIFRRVVAIGVAGYFLYHTVLNIATNLGMFPVSGIPLPFLTYGGSHILVEFFMIGIVLRILREQGVKELNLSTQGAF